MSPFFPVPALPPMSAVSIGVTALQVLLTCSQYFIESAEGKQAPYSKFFDRNKSAVLLVSGRVGMLAIYVPALLFSIRVVVASPPIVFGPRRDTLVGTLLFLHFLKRNLEVLFLHKYSKPMDIMTGVPIGLYYALICWIITHFQHFVPEEHGTALSLTLGLSLFTVGQLGNLYHHWLLTTLRPSTSIDSSSPYKVPSDGLFPLVTMPHYLFELIAWGGVAVTSGSLTAALVVASMASYLGGRAVATRTWYTKNVKGFPKERKAIVPFLF